MKSKIGLIALENLDDSVIPFMFDGNNNNDFINGSSELNEQDVHIDTISELTDSLVTLEAIRNVIPTIDINNITSVTVTPLITSIEHLCNRSNIKFKRNFVLESFDSKVTRRSSLNIVTENLLSTIKEFILKIISWLKNACEYIYKFIRSFSSNSETLNTRSKEVQESLSNLANKKVKEGVHGISGGSLTKYFSSNSKLIDPNSIPTLYKNYTSELGLSFKENYMRDLVTSIKAIVSKASSGDKEDDIYTEVDKVLVDQLHTSFKNFKQNKADDTIFEYELPFDQRIISVVYTKKNDKLVGIKISINNNINNQPANNKAILAILTPQQIDSISKVVGEEMSNGLYKNHEKTIKEIEEISKLINSECDNIVRRQLAQENDSDKNLTYSVQFLKDLVTSMLSILGIIHKYDVLASKNCLDYCEQSQKLYI